MSKNKPKKMGKKSEGGLLKRVIKEGDIWTKASMLIMGCASLRRRQIVKGLLFLLSEAAFIFYMVVNGGNA